MGLFVAGSGIAERRTLGFIEGPAGEAGGSHRVELRDIDERAAIGDRDSAASGDADLVSVGRSRDDRAFFDEDARHARRVNTDVKACAEVDDACAAGQVNGVPVRGRRAAEPGKPGGERGAQFVVDHNLAAIGDLQVRPAGELKLGETAAHTHGAGGVIVALHREVVTDDHIALRVDHGGDRRFVSRRDRGFVGRGRSNHPRVHRERADREKHDRGGDRDIQRRRRGSLRLGVEYGFWDHDRAARLATDKLVAHAPIVE